MARWVFWAGAYGRFRHPDRISFHILRGAGAGVLYLVEFLGLALQAVEDVGIFFVVSHDNARPPQMLAWRMRA